MTAQLSREELEILAFNGETHTERALARMLLAGIDSEPVAWTSDNALSGVAVDMCGMLGPKNAVGDIALYTAPPAPLAVDEIAEQAGIDPDFADAYMQGYHDAEARRAEQQDAN